MRKKITKLFLERFPFIIVGVPVIIKNSKGEILLGKREDIDEFWIATAEIPDAANTITDLEIGIDVLGIAGLGIGFDSLNITQDGDNTLVSFESKNLAILLNTDASILSADHFVFA